MAIDDIPEFVEVSPGDLIRAEEWNRIQREIRNAVRSHGHTRDPNETPDDTVSEDNADQIGSDGLQDGAVTSAKLADGAVTAAKIAGTAVDAAKLANGAVTTAKIASGAVDAGRLANGAVNGSKLANNAVSNAKIGNGAVNASKLANNAVTNAKLANNSVNSAKLANAAVKFANIDLDVVNQGSVTIPPRQVRLQLVQRNVQKTAVLFPSIAILSASGTGTAAVEVTLDYRRTVGRNQTDVFIRLNNTGSASAGVSWRVVTFGA